MWKSDELTNGPSSRIATLKPASLKTEQELAIKQNIATLNRRVNQLGVAEPLVDALHLTRIYARGPKASGAVQLHGLDVEERYRNLEGIYTYVGGAAG